MTKVYITATRRERAKWIFILLLPLTLTSCAKGKGLNLHPYEEHYGRKTITPHNFTLCHGFSCTHETEIKLRPNQWQEVLSEFSPPVNSAKAERQRIAQAVAVMERNVDMISHLHPDEAEAVNFEIDQSQMDCIDETINVSRYLKFFEEAQVLKFHKRHDPVHRGYFLDGKWPHNSAAIEELSTGKIYAVDSYFADSGEPAAIVSLDPWLDNWRPDNAAN